MDIINFDTQDYNDFMDGFINSVVKKDVILFTGAGFSQNHITKSGGIVPTSNALLEYMIKFIKDNDKSGIYNQVDYNSRDFQSICEDYFTVGSENSLEDEQRNYFAKHFVDVIVEKDSPKDKFLNCDWRNIYTLNTDDLIEQNSIKFKEKIDPKSTLKYIKRKTGHVIKIHGDIKTSLLDKEGELGQNIIFSLSSYLRILSKNNEVIRFFVDEFQGKNSVSIGISFKNHEIDILKALEDLKENYYWDTPVKRVYVSKEEPSAEIKINLKKMKYTHIIILGSNEYNDFYNSFNTQLEKNKIQAVLEIKKLEKFNKNISISTLDKTDKLIYTSHKSIYETMEEKNIIIPSYVVERNIYNDVYNSFSKNIVTVITGDKLVGKTITLLKMISKINADNCYFIPTEILIDTYELCDFIDNMDESYFLFFDTNSYKDEHINIITSKIDKIKSTNSKIVFALDNSDAIKKSFLLDRFEIAKNESQNFINIGSKLSPKEVDLLNDSLNKLKLPRFTQKDTIFENMVSVIIDYNEVSDNHIKTLYQSLLPSDFKLLFYIAAFGHMYTTVFFTIKSEAIRLEEFMDKFKLFLYTKTTSEYETQTFSSAKIVAHCRACIIMILSKALKQCKDKSYKIDVVNELVNSIKVLRNRTSIDNYKKLFLFDSLKEIADIDEKEFILDFYEKLHLILYDDPHYYIQRTKATLRYSREDLEECKKAEEYIKKAYIDSQNENSINFKSSAVFTYALLLNRIYVLMLKTNISDEEKSNLLARVIEKNYEAIVIDIYNNKHKRALFNSQKQYSKDFDFVLRECKFSNKTQLRRKATEIDLKKDELRKGNMF